MLKSIITAFSTYSKIPMPRTAWDEKSMRYSMCFFPMVGAVIGALQLALIFLLYDVLTAGTGLAAACLTSLPLFITGGIHFDGYLDTMDAMSSYKAAGEKLKILKDPHIGAFAVIYGVIYIVINYGLMCELYSRIACGEDIKNIAPLFVGYIYSRSLSGFSVVTLKKARTEGMAADTARASDKKSAAVMIIWIAVCVVSMAVFDIRTGAAAVLAGALAFLYYRHMAYVRFGGITGDLAGYFLQLCELAVLMAVTAVVLLAG